MTNDQQPQVPPASAPHEAQQQAAQNAQQQPVTSTQPRKLQILGLHPALFTGILLLILVAILAIILVFTGEIASQGPRVFWTVVGFVAFTGLLALDLSLSRSGSRPLIIGTAANSYMIIVLMLTIWIYRPDPDRWYDDGVWELIFLVPYIVFITRAVWGLSWMTLTLGYRIALPIGRAFGFVTAGLVGVAGILMTLHVPLDRFGVNVGEWYWRSLVAIIILAALAACILLLLVWNQRTNEPPRPKFPAPGGVPYGAPGYPQGYAEGYPVQGYPNHDYPSQGYPAQAPPFQPPVQPGQQPNPLRPSGQQQDPQAPPAQYPQQ